ncbi:alanine racemase [Microbacterium indicum]|uniref:alanine racemase n=1 Tax=Microbacterium indicum TaxID=358100 RepID=UPI0004070AAB|nr:alanine racemase [Microbacterium indicum]
MTAELRVDLAQLRRNVRAVRAHMSPAETMIVIKDDAYALGVSEVAAAAAEAGARWFGGIDIPSALGAKAAAGSTVRVLAWATAGEDEAARALSAGLELGVGDADYLERVARAAEATGIVAPVHLKADTGLHRNGVRPEEWRAFCERARALEIAGSVRVVGLWTHIAEASDAEDDRARAAFDAAIDGARAAGLEPAVRHLAASAAAWHRPEFRYDLVRIGAFAYGVRSEGGPDVPGIAPVASLVARVVRVEGDAAVVDLGSVDGFPSTAAGRIEVAGPAGRRPLLAVGAFESRVAAWDGAAAGDEVVVFGPGTRGELTPTDVGEAIGTVGEEPQLRIARHVRRVYLP